MADIKCKWMNRELNSPFILASLTLFSKPNIEKHIEYFSKAADCGAGAIILPSIHPLREDEHVGHPYIKSVPVASGIGGQKNYMGFALLGTTDNVVSIEYGIALAQEAVKLAVPVVGSVANIGRKEDFLSAVDKMSSVPGLAGLELNFSCPNVQNGVVLSQDLLKAVCEVSHKLPISIKLAPNAERDIVANGKEYFYGFTCSNAYSGLLPPKLDSVPMSPFGGNGLWRPTGVYGPQEKLLTFCDIWKYKTDSALQNIPLSSVGGFVTAEDAVQAIMLGADTVQLSSGVIWNGLGLIRECNKLLSEHLERNTQTLNELKGSALRFIGGHDWKDIVTNHSDTMYVDKNKCRKCKKCACVDKACYAISQEESGYAVVNEKLCNGCGWCQRMCSNGAVVIRQGRKL